MSDYPVIRIRTSVGDLSFSGTPLRSFTRRKGIGMRRKFDLVPAAGIFGLLHRILPARCRRRLRRIAGVSCHQHVGEWEGD